MMKTEPALRAYLRHPTGPITLFLPTFNLGGAERNLLRLTEELHARGEDVELVVSNADGPLRTEVPPYLRVVDLGSPRIRFALPALVRHLRRRRPVCVLSSVEDASILAILAARLAGTGTRVIVRLATTPSRYASDARTLSQRLVIVLMRALYRHADMVVASSRGMADDVARFARVSADRIRVLPNLTVTEAMPRLAAAAVAHPFLRPGAPPVVLAVGSLVECKNFPLLLEAFTRVRSRRTCRLLILGDGPQRRALQRRAEQLGIADDVDLPGSDLNPWRYMANAAVFVLSSDYEGSPNVLIEALACGASVVATDCHSGPREILDGGRYGRLVAVGDVDGLARAIDEALSHPLRAPADAWLPYRSDLAAQGYLDLLREVTRDTHAA